MKKLALPFIGLLLLVGCETEKLIEVEKEFNWQAEDNFRYDNTLQINSHATDEFMFFMGHNYFTSLVEDGQQHPDFQSGDNAVQFILHFTPETNRKLPISDNFFVVYNSNGFLAFVPTRNPVGLSLTFNLADLDDEFKSVNGIYYERSESALINDLNQVLIPYEDNTSKVTMALVDIEYNENKDGFNHKLDTLRTQILTIDEPVQNLVIAMESIGSNFFVTTDSKVYLIDPLGNINTVLNERLYRVFPHLQNLYGIGWNGLFISSDNGFTWNQVADIPTIWSSLNFTEIGEKVIAYRFDQVWEVSINSAEIGFTELDNDGLDGKVITSANQFDDKVFLTTLTGVYSKSFEEFFVPKETE